MKHYDFVFVFVLCLSCEGQKGSQGEQGIQGERGLSQTADGLKGEQGIKGEIGVPGPKGDRGPKGDKGDKGNTGNAGPRGPRGPRGLPGSGGSGGHCSMRYDSDLGYIHECNGESVTIPIKEECICHFESRDDKLYCKQIFGFAVDLLIEHFGHERDHEGACDFNKCIKEDD